jgi:hypothetical protein
VKSSTFKSPKSPQFKYHLGDCHEN